MGRPRAPRHELHELIKWAEAHGCRHVGTSKSGHVVIETPDGVLVRGSATPGDVNGTKAFRRDIEKAMGIEPDRPNAGRYRRGERRERFSMARAVAEAPHRKAREYTSTSEGFDVIEGGVRARLEARRAQLAAEYDRLGYPFLLQEIRSIDQRLFDLGY